MMDKKLLVIGGVLFVFFVIMIVPVIEVTAWKNNQIISQTTTRSVLGSQSILSLGYDQTPDKVDVKVITQQKKEYYLCEGDIMPKTLIEVKKLCSYMGEEGG
jgi:hypothetical protein